MKRKLNKSAKKGDETEDGDQAGDPAEKSREGSATADGQEEEKIKTKDYGRSIWEPRKVDGKIKGWKHRITSEEIRGEKKPPECKGAILADDVSFESIEARRCSSILTCRWV